MAFAFDTLGYANHLKKAGVESSQAEAHAEAARQFIMTELVTKTDLQIALQVATQSMTIRLGAMMVVAVGVIIAALRLWA